MQSAPYLPCITTHGSYVTDGSYSRTKWGSRFASRWIADGATAQHDTKRGISSLPGARDGDVRRAGAKSCVSLGEMR
jgi:hypothetical protein